MENSKPAKTPRADDSTKKIEDKSENFDNITLYQQAIGSLIYLATCTRPDISYSVCRTTQAMSKPTTQNWLEVKRIIRYLQGTKKLGIQYSSEQKNLEIYSDASWAPPPERYSHSGYVFLLNGGAISWKTKKQKCIAGSSTEAESTLVHCPRWSSQTSSMVKKTVIRVNHTECTER